VGIAVPTRYHAPEHFGGDSGAAMSFGKIGKLSVLGTLGTGAHSTILHVRREADGKQYALKVVPIDGPEEQKFLDQARHEFRVSEMLQHPNVIQVFTLEEQKDWLFRVKKAQLLMDYVNGQTLDRFPAMPIPKLVQVFKQTADAMVHMHRRGVYHADLKPNNLMLAKSGQVKVIDFGLAWVKGENKNRVQGTPEYMAPETGTRNMVNERTDIFNFGATMYRLVTLQKPPSSLPLAGALPMDAGTWQKMLKPVCEVSARCPKPLAELIEQCLAFSALERPERMSEVQGRLDRLADDLVKTPEDHLGEGE
jgi:eukaryotic-like serine/threonine-protein kinase